MCENSFKIEKLSYPIRVCMRDNFYEFSCKLIYDYACKNKSVVTAKVILYFLSTQEVSAFKERMVAS